MYEGRVELPAKHSVLEHGAAGLECDGASRGRSRAFNWLQTRFEPSWKVAEAETGPHRSHTGQTPSEILTCPGHSLLRVTWTEQSVFRGGCGPCEQGTCSSEKGRLRSDRLLRQSPGLPGGRRLCGSRERTRTLGCKSRGDGVQLWTRKSSFLVMLSRPGTSPSQARRPSVTNVSRDALPWVERGPDSDEEPPRFPGFMSLPDRLQGGAGTWAGSHVDPVFLLRTGALSTERGRN